MTARERLACRAGAALALLVATCVPTVHAPDADAKERSMQGTANTAPFVFTYTSRGGPEMPGGLQERDSALRVDFDAGVVTYEQHRPGGDTAGEPIGTFRVSLTLERRQRLLAALESDAFTGLGPTSGGSFSSALLTYEFQRGGRTIVKQLSSDDRDQIDRIQPLHSEFVTLRAELFRHPVAAVRAEIRQVIEGAIERFELVVANVGTAPVVVPNPRRLGVVGGSGGARIAVAEAKVPGVTSLQPTWTTLPLEVPVADEPADVTLAPGERTSARTVPWQRTGPAGAAYWVRSFLESYGGPPEVSGVYRVRGAIFSRAIEVAAR